MIETLNLENLPRRVAISAAALVCLTAIFFFAKWCFANAIATQVIYKEIAEMTVDLAPGDPQARYALAVLNERSFLPEDLPRSLAEYEKAAALSPNDFRLWLALGKAREHNDDKEGAERALRKALELAPNYSEVQWTLGNALLRRGKTDEAFGLLRKAAETEPRYTPQTVSIAWQIFEENLGQVKQNLGDSPVVNAALATFLARKKKFDQAMNVWNALPADEKQTALKPSGDELLRILLEERRFREALQVQTQIGVSNAESFAFGKIFNGGFETEVRMQNANVFEWQIAEGLQPQIGFDDAEKRDGNRSLVIVFNSTTGREFRSVWQTVAVETGKNYRFEAFYKSALKTTATLKWEIVDTSNGKVLATTAATSANSDWERLQADFSISDETQAVTIRLARQECKTGICPITGKVWFDDFAVNAQ